MQSCSTRQFISPSQALVLLLQLAAVVIPPRTHAQGTKVHIHQGDQTLRQPTPAAPLSGGNQDRLHNKAVAAHSGSSANCVFNHHISEASRDCRQKAEVHMEEFVQDENCAG